jgi:hypothetical protein
MSLLTSPRFGPRTIEMIGCICLVGAPNAFVDRFPQALDDLAFACVQRNQPFDHPGRRFRDESGAHPKMIRMPIRETG